MLDNDQTITIALIVGTTRPKRESLKVAQCIATEVQKREHVKLLFVDPREFNLPDDGDDAESRDPRYTEITAKADAFYIVTPEYNHSFPGSLKRLLDSEYTNYFHKPVAIAGVSSGQWGGVRVVEALLAPLHRLGMSVIWPECYFPHVEEMFDESGNIHDDFRVRQAKHINKQLDELLWFAHILKDARPTANKLG